MSGPSMAELKASGQPPSVIDRLNDEHWAGRLYMRRISPHATWVFARLGWSPNAVTLAFIACGIAAGVVISFGGLATAIAGAILIQLYLLFDCSDGELARWSGRTSATGVYLDGIGHYLREAALLIGLGIRAQGHLTFTGGYVTAGFAAALLSALVKAETDNVIVARAKAGLSGDHGDQALAATGSGPSAERRRVSPAQPGGRAEGGGPGRGYRRRRDRRAGRPHGACHRLPGRRGAHGRRAPGGDRGVPEVAVKLSCVILTMGDRPAELDRAIASVLAQRDT